MVVPDPPVLVSLKRITPSIYEASLACLAKAVWVAVGDARVLPQNPAAILGITFHAVVAAAHKGKLSVAGANDRSAARALFDRTAQELHLRAHRLVRSKFPSADRLPFYNRHRERAAITATPIAASRSPLASSAADVTRLGRAPVKTEARLSSKDGYLVGRADHIDARSSIVVDYKTGNAAGGNACAVSNSEARQLRLYAYLAAENGTDIRTGAVVRSGGQRCEIGISPAEAEAEADSAKKQLGRLNAAVAEGASFQDLASPSPKNCSFCPCLPFCGRFWAEATPEWTAGCGLHVEGSVAEVESGRTYGIPLTTLLLSTRSGTAGARCVSIEQIPTEWLDMDCSGPPHVGDTVRVVHGRQLGTDTGVAVIRVDKALTSVWRLRQSSAEAPRAVAPRDA